MKRGGNMTNEERIINSKNKIFDAALREFSSKGYSGSSINNITKAGIPKGLLYHIYKNKDEVYLACVGRCYQELITYLDALKSEADLEEYMAVRQKFFSEHKEMGKVIYETFNPVSPSVDEQIQEIKKPYDEFNRSYFRKLLENLSLREGVAIELAEKYFSLVQVAMNTYFLQESEDSLQQHEEVLPGILDLILFGIAKENES